MKKFYIKLVLVTFLILFDFSVYSQAFTFDSSSIINGVGYGLPTTRDSENCFTSLKANFTFPIIPEMQATGWNGYYYKYKVEIIGYKNDGTNQIVVTKEHFPLIYSSIDSYGKYVYTTEVPTNYDLNNFHYYKAKLTIIKYISNNDPGLTVFFPYIGKTVKITQSTYNCGYIDPDTTPDPNNKPDLVLDEDNSTTKLSTNITEVIYANSEIIFKLVVKNEGEVASGNYKVGFYLSTDNKISNSQFITETSFSNTTPNSPQSKLVQISANYFGVYGYAYIHIKLDKDDDVAEGDNGESNNSFSSRKVKINSTFGKPGISKKYLLEIDDGDGLPYALKSSSKKKTNVYSYNETTLTYYPLVIYTFTQKKVVDVIISSKNEERLVIKELPTGFYIVKSIDGTRKIYKE